MPALLAEFIGTFMLVLTVGCNVIAGSPIWGVTSIACVLMVCIYALGSVSGANFNPAVSFALGLSRTLGLHGGKGGMAWGEVLQYMVVQVVAGVLAGFTYSLVLWKDFNLEPQKDFGWSEAGLAEMLYTFMLCFVVLNCCATRDFAEKKPEYYGLAIGFVVVAGGYGAGAVSGGCFNPAVAIGIDVASFAHGIGWCVAYTLFELAGAALAVLLFRTCRPKEFGHSTPDETQSKLCAEFLGTYMLVLTVGLNVLGGSQSPVFSIAAALMCMIYALGSVSGAHFNPAVTLAIVCRGKMELSMGAAYASVQVLGGICGALTHTLIYHFETFPLQPGKDYTSTDAWLAEFFFTFLLCFVVLSVATKTGPLEHVFGLAIGSCVTAGGYAIGAVSGGALNPAVAIAISAVHSINGGSFYQCIGYTAFEAFGAVFAAGLFYATRPGEFAEKKKGAAEWL